MINVVFLGLFSRFDMFVVAVALLNVCYLVVSPFDMF
jgi:hypothetical protein